MRTFRISRVEISAAGLVLHPRTRDHLEGSCLVAPRPGLGNLIRPGDRIRRDGTWSQGDDPSTRTRIPLVSWGVSPYYVGL